MTEKKKNLLVGATVLFGLILLGWMILQFGNIAISPFTAGRTSVTVLTDRADGVAGGSSVLYRGMNVGQVQEVRLADDMRSVVILLQLNAGSRVPANVEAIIRPTGLIGGSAAVFLDLTSDIPTGKLASGAELRGHVGTIDMLPKEFTALANDLRKTSEQFRESGLIKHLDDAVVNISTQATRAGDVMTSVQKLIGDDKFRQDLQTSLANVKDATATANRIATNLEKFSGSLDRAGGNIDRLTSEASDTVRDARAAINKTQVNVDQLTRQIGDRLVQISTLLDTVNSVARKVEQGKGTAGMMVNDPRLYEAMVDSAKQLNQTVADLNRLVQQWEQEGISFKLK